MKPLRILCLQHVPFEGPGHIGTWASQNGHTLTIHGFWEKKYLPDPDGFDFLLVMGGPMGVNDEEKHPFLGHEKPYIRNWHASGKPMLGICLGAQLLACSLGAPVVSNRWKEIGWFPLVAADSCKSHPLLKDFPFETPVFHWHGDTFAIPAGARHLLKSEACVNQAFLLGEKSLGLQFHLEMTPESMEDLLKNGAHELTDERYIQTLEEIRTGTAFFETNHLQLERMLEALTAGN